MEPKTDGDKIADALLEVASALRALGNNNAATEMGAIEGLAKEVHGVSESLDGVAAAVQQTTPMKYGLNA